MTKKILFVAAIALIACNDDPIDPDTDPSLTLSADSVAIAIGSSTTVNATITNATGFAEFESRNTAVATVNTTGTITGVEVGTTYVVSTLNNMASVRDSVRVRVMPEGQLGTMQLLGTGSVPERWTSEVAAFGNVAYTGTWGFRGIGTAGDAIKVWNVTGNTPLLVDSLIIAGAGTVSDVQISDDGALLVASLENGERFLDNGLVIYARTNPLRPTLLDRFASANTSPGVHTVKLGRVSGRHYAFLAVNVGRLVIVDITDPANPVEVFAQVLGTTIHDTFIRDGILFVALWGAGLHLYDVGGAGRGGTPSAPVALGSVVTSRCQSCAGGANVHNVWWFHDPTTSSKRYAFVGEEGPGDVGNMISRGALHVVDVSNFDNPVEVAVYEPSTTTTVNQQNAGAHNFVMDEASGILYAAFYNGGVRALDVRGDLGSCTQAQRTNGFCDLLKMGREVSVAVNTGAPKYIWGVARVGNALYASDMHVGIHKIDISALQR